MTYEEKLKSPKWLKKRVSILVRDNYTCVSCNREDLPLHVHHIFYFPNTDPWDYEDHHLVTYCELCHGSEHLIGNKINESLVEIIKENHLLIKPLAQVCILSEKYPPFIESLKPFLNNQLSEYLKSMKPNG